VNVESSQIFCNCLSVTALALFCVGFANTGKAGLIVYPKKLKNMDGLFPFLAKMKVP
jgi:hypothetical protein